MDYAISGTVTFFESEYFTCPDFTDLRVDVYGIGFGTISASLGNGSVTADASIPNKGAFAFGITTTTYRAFKLKLYLIVGEDSVLLGESPMFCQDEPISAAFNISDSIGGTDIYTRVYDGVLAILTEPATPESVLPGLIPAENSAIEVSEPLDNSINEISCLACINKKTVLRLQKAMKLWLDFLSFEGALPEPYSAYPLAGTGTHSFAGDPNMGKAVFFALGLKFSTLHAALTHSRNQFTEILQAAIDRNEIVSTVLDDDTVLDQLEACRDAVLFNAENDGAYYNAKLIHLINVAGMTVEELELLKRALLNDCLDNGIDKTLLVHSGEPAADFLAKLKRISEHLQHFIPFVALAIAEEDVINEDYFALAKEGPDYWIELMPEEHAVPYNPAYSEPDSDLNYANDIFNSISEKQPTARLIYNIGGSDLTEKTAILAILIDPEYSDFNINEHSVDGYFESSLTDEEKEPIQALQRSLRLTGENEPTGISGTISYTEGAKLAATRILMDNREFTPVIDGPVFNLTTSLGVTNLGRGQFVALMTPLEGGISVDFANQIYCQGKAVMEANVAAVTDAYLYGEIGGASAVPYALNLNNLNLPEDTFDDDVPDMETLFGSFDSCACEQCQSVYSAAAYFTDLLNWLNKDVVCSGFPTKSGLNALKKKEIPGPAYINRREDLVYLYLTCENTNTLVPYIDLVNEILSMNLSTPTASDFILLQTNKTAEEILAEPENQHLFQTNEGLLKAQNFDWTLPYNVPFDGVISLSKGLGKPYHELIHDFSTAADKYNSLNWAIAYLEICPEEATILKNNHLGSGVWTSYWGISIGLISSDFATIPQNIGPFLKAAKISIAELEEFLGAYYINQGGGMINLNPTEEDACDIDNYTFSQFSQEAGDRLMRFIRLIRRTSLSIWQLDMAIKHLSPSTGIDEAFLIKLASCMAFSKKFNIPFSELLVWFGNNAYVDLITNAPSEYFVKKFRNPVFPDAVINFFTTTYSSLTISGLTNKEKQYLSKTLKISIPAIEAVIDYITAPTPVFLATSTKIDVVLPMLDRYSSFIRAFGIETDEIDNTLRLLDDPFLAGDVVKAAWDFSEFYSSFSELNTSLTDFKNVTEGINEYSLADLETAAETLWIKVEKAYQEARKANPNIIYSGSPLLPTGADLVFYTDLLVDNIDLEFSLGSESTKSIITKSFASFLNDFLADPDATREWAVTNAVFSATISDVFTPVYQLLKTISVISEICNVNLEGIDSAVKIELDATVTVSATTPSPFYWFKDTFPSISSSSIKDFLWINNVAKQVELLDITQSTSGASPYGYYYFIQHYYVNNGSTYNSSSRGPIEILYNNLGVASPYLKLSVHEFTETFLRARAIASVATDLISVMETFHTIVTATTKANINPLDGWAWVWSVWSGSFTEATIDYTLSGDIRRAFREKFQSFNSWSDAIVPIQNNLRERLRDALVAMYIATKSYQDENEIYGNFLLDTQMAPCMLTSRIVSAISSAQLLVHRALLKIEDNVCMDETDKKEWEWRKNYRVWEANRKVFLYPENWIDPSLRRDKTELFKEAEEILQQDEINDANCELAYATYLTGLNEVSNLDVRAVYVDDPKAPTPKNNTSNPDVTYHVFARTWNQPYKYFYRKFEQGKWLGWEKLDIEIDSDHLIPAMFNRKLYLFFPIFVDRIFTTDKGYTLLPKEEKRPYFEVKMAYTKFDFGKWSQKKILNGKLLAGSKTYQGLDFNREEKLKFLVADNPPTGYKTAHSNNVFSSYYSLEMGYWNSVSMKKEDFYFWAENRSDGSLQIHCHRGLNPLDRITPNADTYTEFAVEYSFVINPIDETTQLLAPAQEIYDTYGGGSNELTKPRFLARPYMTTPYYQQMKWGKAIFNKGTGESTGLILTPPVVNSDFRMFVKNTLNEKGAAYSIPLISITNPCVLTYPQQYKHSGMGIPFFFYDGYRNYFFRFKSYAMGTINLPPQSTN